MGLLSEVGLVFLLIQLAIWSGEISKALPWLIGLAPLAFALRYWRRNPKVFKLLFKPAGNELQYLLMIFTFVFFERAIGLIGEFWNPSFFVIPYLPLKMLKFFLLYLPWAFFQQLLLNGYFYNRLCGLEDAAAAEDAAAVCINGISQKNAVLISGILFSLVHIPNPVLLAVTLIGGWLSAYFFQRARNIYLLAVFHAILAVSTMYCLPEAWHHHLRIGPGFYTWHP
ncbi:MAG: CPBP family intramembrane metalloprotease [Candidatus Harrisonbacteria bacterium]|nr:CPBP family intramembrane metalloprotease [Candidatus Harrisonbacteria bacterium]